MEANTLAFTPSLMGSKDTDLVQLSKPIYLAGRELALHNPAHIRLCSQHPEPPKRETNCPQGER